MNKEECIEYIQHFDKIFGTNVMSTFNENKLIIFLQMYEKMKDELYIQTEEYLSLQKEKLEILDNLSSNLKDAEKEQFNRFLELDSKSKEKSNNQIIVFEFILLNLMNM